MLFGGKKEAGPIATLREHMSTYMYWVKVGKSKFRHKKEVGKIFLEMESTEYLFQQAVSGTMYDYQRKIERNVWAAAIHKYEGDMAALKEALIRAVDACDAEKAHAEEAAKEEEAAEEEEQNLSLKEQMARAEAKEKEEEAKLAEEKEQYAEDREESEETEAMTEADCKELWRIYQGLAEEFKEMRRIADRWIVDHPPKGCLGVTLMLITTPLALAYGLLQIL